jgi:two-component system CheB/CheR fusion protein
MVERMILEKRLMRHLLTKYASVGVIVNEQLDILQFRGITSAYLEAPPGRASHNILTMAREGLAFELRSALHKAKESNEVVKKRAFLLEKRHAKLTLRLYRFKTRLTLIF